MIDVLILNYNDAETTLSYIDHIVDYKVIHKIVVVDNCSTDDSVVLFQKHHFDKVEVIATKENGGYGSGNNYGIKYLVENYNSDYILISNPDVIVEENTIIQLELFLRNMRIMRLLHLLCWTKIIKSKLILLLEFLIYGIIY